MCQSGGVPHPVAEPGRGAYDRRMPQPSDPPDWQTVTDLSSSPLCLFERQEGRVVLVTPDGAADVGPHDRPTLVEGPLDAAVGLPDGGLLVCRGASLLRCSGDTEVDCTAAFRVVPPESPALVCTAEGEIWVSGASRRLRLDGSYAPTPTSPLEGPAPVPATTDLHGNHWTLAGPASSREVLVCPANTPDAWQFAGLPAGDWEFLLADRHGFVWVAGAGGWRRLRPVERERGWADVSAALAPPTAVALSPRGSLLAGLATGEVLEADTTADGEVAPRRVGQLPGAVRALQSTGDGAMWAATDDRLYRREAEADAWQRTWSQRPGRLPGGGNHDVFAARVGRRVYVAGGWAGAWGWPATRHVCQELFALDLATGYWEVASQLHIPKRYNGIAAFEERIWVVGGETRTAGREGDGQALYLVDIYDPTSGTWSAGPPLNDVRTDPFVVTCAGRIWAIGGAAHNPGPKLATVESIGPGETAWRFEPPLPEPTRQGHACALDGVIYCASMDGIFAFDTSAGAWIEDLPQPPGPLSNGLLAAAYEGRVWVMGGFDHAAVQCYDPATRTWEAGPDLPTRQAWGAAIVVDDELMIIGGAHGATPHEGVIYDDRTFVLRR